MNESSSGSPRFFGVTPVLVTIASYFLLGAIAAFYVLPVAFGLAGTELLFGRIAVLLCGAAIVSYTIFTIRRESKRRQRLVALARRMGWEYTPCADDRIWGGSIQDQIDRQSRHIRDMLSSTDPRATFDAALHTFSVGDGDGATINSTLAVRIPLPVEVPRITLRSKQADGPLSELPRTTHRRASLNLEGNFNDVFDVGVPPGYERDALYVLTPDLMVDLMDFASGLDMEIVDRTLHVYFEPIDLTDPSELARFLSIVGFLHARFGQRTFLYRDDSAPQVSLEEYRRAGDTLAAAARKLPTRRRFGPVALAVLAPLIPLLIASVWMHFFG